MVTILSPENMIQMTSSTWENFKLWYSAWQYATIAEMVFIFLLIVYINRARLTKDNFIRLLKTIGSSVRSINESIKRAQIEQWQRDEKPVFGIGKFWAFVLSGLFTFIALSCVFVLGYFAVVAENIATYNMPELIQIDAANHLLFRMGFIQNYLWAVFIISLLVIFRDYIELLWNKLQINQMVKPREEIPQWIYRGLRYSILVLFTTVSYLAIYCMALIIPSSLAGSAILTNNVALSITDEIARVWCNMSGVYSPYAVIFLFCWIFSVWLMAFGYLLKNELDYLWRLIKQIPKWIYNFITANDMGV